MIPIGSVPTLCDRCRRPAGRCPDVLPAGLSLEWLARLALVMAVEALIGRTGRVDQGGGGADLP